MVQLKSLKSDPNKRTIRNVIKSPTGDITVYEPTKESVEAIMGLQEFILSLNSTQNKENESQLDISDATVMKKIIPLLTDIEVGNMTDEEVNEVLLHPSMAMMELNQILSGIVTTIYKMVLLSYAGQLQSAELEMETTKLSHAAVGQFVMRASETDKGKDLLEQLMSESNKIDQLSKENLKDVIKKPEAEQDESDVEDVNITVKKSTEQNQPRNNNHIENLTKDLEGRFGDELEVD